MKEQLRTRAERVALVVFFRTARRALLMLSGAVSALLAALRKTGRADEELAIILTAVPRAFGILAAALDTIAAEMQGRSHESE